MTKIKVYLPNKIEVLETLAKKDEMFQGNYKHDTYGTNKNISYYQSSFHCRKWLSTLLLECY